MYRLQYGFQRKDANMRMLWLRETTIRFLFDSASLSEDLNPSRVRSPSSVWESVNAFFYI